MNGHYQQGKDWIATRKKIEKIFKTGLDFCRMYAILSGVEQGKAMNQHQSTTRRFEMAKTFFNVNGHDVETEFDFNIEDLNVEITKCFLVRNKRYRAIKPNEKIKEGVQKRFRRSVEVINEIQKEYAR